MMDAFALGAAGPSRIIAAVVAYRGRICNRLFLIKTTHTIRSSVDRKKLQLQLEKRTHISGLVTAKSERRYLCDIPDDLLHGEDVVIDHKLVDRGVRKNQGVCSALRQKVTFLRSSSIHII
jgi:hypothetical protein